MAAPLLMIFALRWADAHSSARRTLYGVAEALNALMVVLLVAAVLYGLPMLAGLLRRCAHAMSGWLTTNRSSRGS